MAAPVNKGLRLQDSAFGYFLTVVSGWQPRSTKETQDILVLVHGIATSALPHYDHVIFPGAVPRSSTGPLILAFITYPLAVIGQAVGVVSTSADVQTVMRCALVLLTTKSLASFANALFTPPKLTRREAGIHRACFDIITALQFHFLFWASRTTPNSIALPFFLYAFKLIAALPTSQPRFLTGMTLLTFLASTLRLELAGFLIPGVCQRFKAGIRCDSDAVCSLDQCLVLPLSEPLPLDDHLILSRLMGRIDRG
ncbi:hypothetical protein CF326_g6477 [Tilletia indica]|nr:hypothetical protein CF326_g6477 [Tilletia indica]